MPSIDNNVATIKSWLDSDGLIGKLLMNYNGQVSFTDLINSINAILQNAPEDANTFEEINNKLNKKIEEINKNLDNKVNTREGYDLSEKNFSYEDKDKLDNLVGFDGHYIINFEENELKDINSVLNKISETVGIIHSSRLCRITVNINNGEFPPVKMESILLEGYEADTPYFLLFGHIVPASAFDIYSKYDAYYGEWKKITLDGADIDIDSELSATSTNPVQNKVITTELNKKVDKVEGKDLINYLEINRGGGYLLWEDLINPDYNYNIPKGVNILYSDVDSTYEYGILIHSYGDEDTLILITPSGEIKKSIYVIGEGEYDYWSPWEDVFSSGGGSNITVDSALSLSSTNPVQNKVITAELNKKAGKDNAFDGIITVRGNPLETEVLNQSEYSVRGVYKVNYFVSIDDYTTLGYVGLLIVEDESTSTDDYTEDMLLQTFITNRGIYHRRSYADSWSDWQEWEKITVSQYDFDKAIGNIETALDNILLIQDELTGASEAAIDEAIELADSYINGVSE